MASSEGNSSQSEESFSKECESFLRQAFARNIGLVSEEEQQRLHRATVAIPGMGGVGGSHLTTMARLGVCNFHLADFDVYEPVNINRQTGARKSTFSRKKLEVMSEVAKDINPCIRISEFPAGLNDSNMDEFLKGVDIVLDGIDFFSLDTRRKLFNTALEKGIPVVTAGPLGFSAAVIVFMPGQANFDQYFNFRPGMSDFDKALHFLIGLAPKGLHFGSIDPRSINLQKRSGPSSILACLLCSAMAGMEAVRIYLGRPGVKAAPYFRQFDLYSQRWVHGRLAGGNRHPLQRLKMRIAKQQMVFNKRRSAPYVKPEPTAPGGQGEDLTDEFLDYLIEAGTQAPSGDNAQPWRFKKGRNSLSVRADYSADKSFFNVRQLATIISCGAVTENIKIAAAASGWDTDVDLAAGAGEDSSLMAGLRFKPLEGKAGEPLASVIWDRCTNRIPFRQDPVASEVLKRMQEACGELSGARLHLLSDRKDISEVAELVYGADRIRSERKDVHEHFVSMVRYTPEEVLRTLDGLPLKNLEAGAAGERFLKMTRSWGAMNLANKLGMGKMAAAVAKKGILNSGAVGLVTAPGLETKDFLAGGRGLQRAWLTATREGLCFQPMTVITLFWLRWLLEGEESFSDAHRKLLKDIWPRLQKLFPDVDFKSRGTVMLFRIGHGPQLKHGTYRKDIEAFTA